MATATKMSIGTTVFRIWTTPISPEVASPVNTPNMSQPTTSFAMPAATVICPKSRRIRPSSLRILATTASEDTLSANATNNAKLTRSAPSAKKMSGNAYPTASPPMSGRIKLPVVTNAAGRPSLRIRSRSVSNPVTTNSSATPTHATPSSAADCTSS